jgi:cobalt-zinc-cadmium efflux system protein
VKDRCEAGDDSCLPEASGAKLGAGTPAHAHDHHGHDHGHDHDGHDHHHHDHDHDHGPARHGELRASDRKRLLFALGLSCSIFVAELVGGLLSRSLALVSDAGHVLADMSGLFVSLVAITLASRPPTAKRTFGYHRLEILAALANGVVLVTLAALVVSAAVQRLGAPVEVHADIMLPVAGLGLVANTTGAWLLHGAHSLNARSAYLHVLSDALSSLAVLVGGAVIAIWPRLAFIDPLLGLLIAAVVVNGAVRLLREAVDVLLEAVPRGVDLEEVRARVRALPGIVDVHDLHIWTITSGLTALSAHVVVAEGTASDPLLRSVKSLLLREHKIGHSTIQVESTAYDQPD